jgi:hypothetical protein
MSFSPSPESWCSLAGAVLGGFLTCAPPLTGDAGTTAIARVLIRGCCPVLQRLDLMDSGVGDDGVRALAGLLTSRRAPPALEVSVGMFAGGPWMWEEDEKGRNIEAKLFVDKSLMPCARVVQVVLLDNPGITAAGRQALKDAGPKAKRDTKVGLMI